MKKYSSHLGYFDVITACAQNGCPICQLGKREVNKYLDITLYESVTDPDIRDQLRTSLGYCKTHAWLLPTVGKSNYLGIAIIYHDILEIVKHILPQESYSGHSGVFLRLVQALFKRKKPLKAHEYRSLSQQRCPACMVRDETETNALKILLKALAGKNERMQDALKTSDGLCFPHLKQAFTLTQNRMVSEKLMAITQEKIAKIQEDLGEFIRKHDYRFQHESIGEEKESWNRAIHFIVGAD
jgi:hypothetical protein